jgi:antibiotic biosynthesis monooxygenase (ABM) superfamily enzyme
MPATPYINLVGTKCRPDQETKYNKWYDEIHIPMLLKFKGLKAVTRYKLAADDKNASPYISIFQFESKEALDAYNKSPELAAAREEMKQSWPDVGCWEVTQRTPYQQIFAVKK